MSVVLLLWQKLHQLNPTPKVTKKMAEAVQDETALHLDETVVDPKDTVEHVLDTVEVER